MTVIIICAVALSLLVVVCSIYQGRNNALRNEREELLNVIEDKDKRIENLIKFKRPCFEWKIVKTESGSYLIELFRNGEPWQAYAEMDAEGVVATIMGLS